MTEKHYFVVLFILSVLIREYFTSEIIFALYKPYCNYKEKKYIEFQGLDVHNG